MVRRLLLCACIVLSGTGCGIVEELDKGMDIMNTHFGDNTDAKKAAAAEAEAEFASTPAKADPDYWKNARTITSGEGLGEVTSCNLRGQMQFMKREDCVRRGGKPN
jgi:hypothetical protein